MRVHGIQAQDGAGSTGGPGGGEGKDRAVPWRASLAAFGLVIAGIAVYVTQTGSEPADDPAASDSPVGVDDELSALLSASPGIEAFAKQAASGKPDGEPRARAIVKAIRERASAAAFVPWSMVEARQSPPMVAAEAFSTMAQDGGRAHLYPLEVAAVAVAAMRSVGVDGKVAEVYWFEGDRSPPDPSGLLGYFGVVVGTGDAERLLDPYGGREASVAMRDRSVLSDEQAVAAAVSLRAAHQANPAGDAKLALRDSDNALEHLPRSPSVRVAHGMALLVSGAGVEGMREFNSAQQLRDDAPRNQMLGFALMAQGDFAGASTRIARALELAPEYALAHVSLARLHLAQANRQEAHEALAEAQRLDPAMPNLPLVWSAFYMASGDWEEALVRAKAAVEAQPSNPEAHITVARAYRELGKYDDMRRHARALVDLVAPAQRSRTRDLVTAMLGPTALEEVQDSVQDDGEAEADGNGEGAPDLAVPPSDDAFDLRAGSKLLGGGQRPGLQLGGQKPKLGVGSGEKLKLKLDL